MKLARAWTAFHADDGAELSLAWLLLGLPAGYLAVDAGCRWTTLDVPVILRAFGAAAIWGVVTKLWLARGFAVNAAHAAIMVAALALAFAALACLYDTSYDGMSYHLPAILSLAEGWNPIAGPGTVLPANWYANGIWTLRAALFALCGTLEGSKVVSAAIMLGTLFALRPALATLLETPLTSRGLLGVYLLVANPVATGQLFTSYVDGDLYEAGLATVAGVLLTASAHRRFGLAILAASIVLMTGAKITGALYAVALPLAVLAVMWRRMPEKRLIVVTIGIAIAVSVIVIGYRPYITTLGERAAFLELRHAGTIASPEPPPELADLPAQAAFLVSIFARTSGREDVVHLKLPFTVRPHELIIMGTPDPVVGGFGPLFAIELLLALALGGLAWRSERRSLLLLAAALAALSIAFPVAWWARLAPFFWPVPLLIVQAVPWRQRPVPTFIATAVLVCAASNAALAFGGNLARTALGDWRTRSLERVLADRGREVLIVPVEDRNFEDIIGYRLRRAGIPYRVIAEEACKTVIRQERVTYCAAGE